MDKQKLTKAHIREFAKELMNTEDGAQILAFWDAAHRSGENGYYRFLQQAGDLVAAHYPGYWGDFQDIARYMSLLERDLECRAEFKETGREESEYLDWLQEHHQPAYNWLIKENPWKVRVAKKIAAAAPPAELLAAR